MKNFVKRMLSAIGYRIENISNINPLRPKYIKLFNEHYNLFLDLKFLKLPELNERTIDLILSLDGTQPSEAIYIIGALEEVKLLKGDVCEFGVAQGYTSAFLANAIKDTSKDLWLFDSFEGLPAPTIEDKLKDDIFNLNSIDAYQGKMKHSINSVLDNLKSVNFPKKKTNIVDGFIEDTIKLNNLPKSVAFAYVDFDFYFPIKTALDFLNTVLVDGGIIIVDDYDFFSEGAKIAVDQFYATHKDKYSLELPMPSAGHFAILKRI